MKPMLLIVLDLLLALGLTLRLSRLVVADDIGEWWIKKPIARWIDRKFPVLGPKRDRAFDYWEGLSCPFCVGFWIAGAVLLSLFLVGGPGDAAVLWRWIAGWFALNWIAAHIGARAGDTA
jgi:hypothetical protein